MTKNEFIELLSKKMDCSLAEANRNLTHVLNAFRDVWFQGEELTLPGFGKLCISERAARMGRDPKTGRALSLAAKKTPMFKIGQALKLQVNSVLKE